MKKYIWITLYFIGLVWLSYTFFYISEKNKTEDKKIVNNQNNTKKQNTVKKDNTLNTEWKNIQDEDIIEKIKTIDKVNEENDKQKDTSSTVDNSKNTNNNDISKKEENDNIPEKNNKKDIVLEDIYIWLAHWKLVKDSKYEEIYDILNLGNLPLYKIEDKEIYIKKLKSIEYETEKNIIEQLIHKIWGNIVETNLFGDKQLFVNMDVYYKVKSILLIEYDKNLYLVVLPYKKYKDYKSYLKNVLFAK